MDFALVHDRGGFSEGLRWFQGELWFSDFLDRTVYSLDEQGNLTRRAFVPGQPSGLGFLPDGTPLVVSWYDQKVLRIRPDRSLELHASVRDLVVGGANDMFVDPSGRAYVGSIGREPYTGATSYPSTQLVIVEPDGQVRAGPDGLCCPNGIVMSQDGSLLIVSETFTHRLTAFDVRADGSLSGRRVFAELPGRGPDGLCMDADGAVWVACWATGEFVRVRDGGLVEEAVTPVPGGAAMSCVLGGPDRRTLYCSTGSPTGIHDGVGSGKIHTLRVATAGFDVAARA